MAQVDKTVKVEQGVSDLFTQVAALIGAVKAAGPFGAGAIPADVAAVVAELPKIVSDVQMIPGELADSKMLCIKSANLGAYEVLEAVGVKV